jgi:hypothetical protein
MSLAALTDRLRPGTPITTQRQAARQHPTAHRLFVSVEGRQYLAIAAGGVTPGTGLLEGLTPELNTPPAGKTVSVFALAEQAR